MSKQAKYYVTMTDKFMSGWGYAKDKINKLVIECDSMKEAFIIEKNANDRSEMKHINIVSKKPYYSKDRYYTSYHSKPDYQTWFQTNRPFLKK